MLAIARTLAGTVLGPLALALLASLPAVGSPQFLHFLTFNAAVALPLFVVCAAISHLILRAKRWTGWREYAGVMFAVATVVLALTQGALLLWIFGSGGSEYHSGTQVIAGGRFTVGGVVLTVVEAMVGALTLTASFLVFWVVAVRPRHNRAHDA
jgi:energy-converting hydrogenase Eha subunit E